MKWGHWLCLWKQTLVSYWLLFLFLLLASLTAQGLSLQEMQPWSTTCSQVFFDVIQQLTLFQLWWRSTFDGVQLLVELSFWWSSSSHSFGFAQWWRFLFSYYCCCAHLSAVVERCLWHRLVHTATQLSKQGPDLLATGPGFDPRWRPSWLPTPAFFYFFYVQRRRSCSPLLIGCRHKHGVCLTQVSMVEGRSTQEEGA